MYIVIIAWIDDAIRSQMVSPVFRVGLENELRAEREQRQNLQKSLQREQDNSIELRTQLQQLHGLHVVSGRSLIIVIIRMSRISLGQNPV